MARSALLLVPHAVVSHHTAAQLWGGAVPESPYVHVSVGEARQRRRRRGIVTHVGRAIDPVFRGSLALTSPARTFCDLADQLALVDLVVLGDSLVHHGCLGPADLVAAARMKRSGCSRQARRAAYLVREGVESPMETRVRLMMVFAGLAEPRINVTVRDVEGTVQYRLDLSYPDIRCAIEYDGRQHALDADQWARDLSRREWLDDQQWRLVVVRAHDVFSAPWECILRIARVLRSCGYDKPLPERCPLDFRLHFPGHARRSAAAG